MVVIVMALRLALMECLARNLKILYCLQWRAICGRSQPHPFQHSCAFALSLLCMRASVCSCIWSHSSSYFILAGQHEHRTSVLPRRKSSTFLRMKTFGVDGVSSVLIFSKLHCCHGPHGVGNAIGMLNAVTACLLLFSSQLLFSFLLASFRVHT